MSSQLDLIPLGKTDLRVTPLGLGTWQWGDTMTWEYGKGYGEADLKQVYEATLAAGINFIDTAEVYHFGGSEKTLGLLLPKSGQDGAWPSLRDEIAAIAFNDSCDQPDMRPRFRRHCGGGIVARRALGSRAFLRRAPPHSRT